MGKAETEYRGKDEIVVAMAEEKSQKEIKYIVRIAGKDIEGTMPIYQAVQDIKGISHRIGKAIAFAFEKETGVPFNLKVGELDDEKEKLLEEIILNPAKHGIPGWLLNRRNEFETGTDTHRVMADLDFSLRKDIQRLNEIKSYRGLRHSWGLPVRGQKTKSTHRGKGGAIGVVKKDVAAKAAQAAGAGKAEKKEEKK